MYSNDDFQNLPNSTSGTLRIVADLICIEDDSSFTALRGSVIGGDIDGGGGGIEEGGGANNVGGGAESSITGTIVACAGGASSGMLGLDFFFLPMV